jgi:hypothetical protein
MSFSRNFPMRNRQGFILKKKGGTILGLVRIAALLALPFGIIGQVIIAVKIAVNYSALKQGQSL